MSMKLFFRSVLVATFLVFAQTGPALAACGVGTTLWEGNDAFLAKVAAFTTNVWTFKALSTTFNSSGCTEDDGLFGAVNARIEKFASANLDHLSVDMARGSGEHLGAFAHVIELEKRDLPAFRLLTHDHFEELFPADDTTSVEMLEVLANLMAENKALMGYVRI
jgi:hypothetical protein